MPNPASTGAAPDLYAQCSAGGERYRILARLARGGGLPPVRRPLGPALGVLLAMLVAVAATGCIAWLLVHGPDNKPLQAEHPFAVHAEPPAMSQQDAEQRAAAIVNEPLQTHVASAPSRAVAATPATPTPAAPARPAKPRRQPRQVAGDDDAKLLAAVLAHARRQTPPAKEPDD